MKANQKTMAKIGEVTLLEKPLALIAAVFLIAGFFSRCSPISEYQVLMTSTRPALRALRELRDHLLLLVAAFLVFSFLPMRVSANGSITLLHFFCVPELGYFEFGGIAISNQKAIDTLEAEGEKIAAKYGLHDPRDYFNFADEEGRRNFRVVGSRKAHIVCELEGSVVDVVYEPKLMFREIGDQLTVRINGRLVTDDLRFDDHGGDNTGIGGFTYNAGSRYIFMRGALGPTTQPYLPVYNIGALFEFGPGIAPLRDYKTVFEKMVDGLEPPKSRRLRRID